MLDCHWHRQSHFSLTTAAYITKVKWFLFNDIRLLLVSLWFFFHISSFILLLYFVWKRSTKFPSKLEIHSHTLKLASKRKASLYNHSFDFRYCSEMKWKVQSFQRGENKENYYLFNSIFFQICTVCLGALLFFVNHLYAKQQESLWILNNSQCHITFSFLFTIDSVDGFRFLVRFISLFILLPAKLRTQWKFGVSDHIFYLFVFFFFVSNIRGFFFIQ